MFSMWCFLVKLKSNLTVGKRRSWPPLLTKVVCSRLGSPVALGLGDAVRICASKALTVGSPFANCKPAPAARAKTSVEQRKAAGEPAGDAPQVVFSAGAAPVATFVEEKN